jgi:hypothetical protein
MLDEDKRADLLKDEYIMLQQFYEQIDNKGLTIKNWSITVALAAIGTGILYNKNVLWAGFAAALLFWYLEAHWRGLSYFFSVRIQEIELAFQNSKWKEETPLQVYATWSRAYQKEKDQTFRYMFKQTSSLPHVVIAAICFVLYFLLPK